MMWNHMQTIIKIHLLHGFESSIFAGRTSEQAMLVPGAL